jgi:hypothetical protein
VSPTSVFEPDDPNELLRGWLLHAHKGRDRHDLAARRCDQRRYLLGIPATIISGIVGTTTFAALEKSPDQTLQVVVGVLAILAAILVSLQAFLDLGARAERHRLAGVRYKAVIRQLEQLGIGTIRNGKLDAPVLTEMRQRLDALEEEMPVVPPGIYDRIESKYRDLTFIDSIVGRPEVSPRGGGVG